MKNILRLAILILFVLLSSFSAFAQSIQSPDGKLSLTFALTAEGEPTHQLSFSGKPVLQKSKLGLELKDQPAFSKGFTIVAASIKRS